MLPPPLMPWKWFGVRIASFGSVGEVLGKDLAIAIWMKDIANLLLSTTISVPTEKGKTMAEILQDPLKKVMLIILAMLEVPAIIFLVVAWFKAKKEYGERDVE